MRTHLPQIVPCHQLLSWKQQKRNLRSNKAGMNVNRSWIRVILNHRPIHFSVKHLTSLLAEAEQDLAKLTQLNDVLKEELRRQERSAAREQHLHNLEYLKNVIFKVS